MIWNRYEQKDYSYRISLLNSNAGLLMSRMVYRALTISSEEYEKHRGKHVASYEGKIIADGSKSIEALEKALKTHPKLKPDQMALFYIQITDVLIL